MKKVSKLSQKDQKIRKNPVLSARYAHILWESPNKHGKYAEIAIDSYLELVEIWTEKDRANPDELYGLSVVESIRTAYYLARNSNNRNKLKKIITKIKELFSVDELFFFKFILVDQAGFNLRHKVAHSLIFLQEYNLSMMNLLLIILLRIAKYDFKEKEEQEFD